MNWYKAWCIPLLTHLSLIRYYNALLFYHGILIPNYNSLISHYGFVVTHCVGHIIFLPMVTCLIRFISI